MTFMAIKKEKKEKHLTLQYFYRIFLILDQALHETLHDSLNLSPSQISQAIGVSIYMQKERQKAINFRRAN